jgi:hypothetical protein
MPKLLQRPADIRRPYPFSPLALHLKNDRSQSVHWDIFLLLATVFASMPVKVKPNMAREPQRSDAQTSTATAH